jgi:hypothetical protein
MEDSDNATKQYCMKFAKRELVAYKDQKQRYHATIESRIKVSSKVLHKITQSNEFASPCCGN